MGMPLDTKTLSGQVRLSQPLVLKFFSSFIFSVITMDINLDHHFHQYFTNFNVMSDISDMHSISSSVTKNQEKTLCEKVWIVIIIVDAKQNICREHHRGWHTQLRQIWTTPTKSFSLLSLRDRICENLS